MTVENLLWLRLQPAATLTHARTGVPLAGKPIVFSAGTQVICTAITNAQGAARCTGLLPLLATVLSLGYDARYLGGTGFAPAFARGSLVTVSGINVR